MGGLMLTDFENRNVEIFDLLRMENEKLMFSYILFAYFETFSKNHQISTHFSDQKFHMSVLD